jgi:ubiquinone/menaquinone biosynthesis C-methylase UbiE
MFYHNRLKNIAAGDKVLEIGPGISPHPRSDVFLELKLENDEEYAKQFGQRGKLETDKKVVFYDGQKFPFADKEFDYIICSHVLEHVPDVDAFLSEIFRTGKKGYFEYPLITYEYLFNYDVHLQFLYWDGEKLLYKKKNTTSLNEFRPVQDFFCRTVEKKFDTYFKKIPEFFIQGFEWDKPFPAEKSDDLEKFIVKDEIPELIILPENEYSIGQLTKAVLKKIKRKCLGE